MNDSPFSDDLVAWAGMAGSAPHRDGDGWALWDDGGSLSDILRHVDGEYELTFSERGAPAGFRMRAPDADDIERYLICRYGTVIRGLRGLPFLFRAWKPEDIKSGWTVDQSGNQWVLVSPDGVRRASFHDDDAVAFSWVAETSLDDLRASYLSTDGSPLFPGCWMGPPYKYEFTGVIPPGLRFAGPESAQGEIEDATIGYVVDSEGRIAPIDGLVRQGMFRKK